MVRKNASRSKHTRSARQRQRRGANELNGATSAEDLGKLVQQVAGYMAIPLGTLRLDKVTGFDLYLRNPGSHTYILYRRGDLTFTEEHRERLRESSVREVYISAADHGKYLRYLEGNLGAILADSTVSSTEKAKILYSSASHLVEDIFRIRHGADGRSGRGVRRLDGETCLGGSQQSGQPSQGHVLRLLNLHPLRECVCLRCRAGPAGRAGARGA